MQVYDYVFSPKFVRDLIVNYNLVSTWLKETCINKWWTFRVIDLNHRINFPRQIYNQRVVSFEW
jgi:hypothetical protein